MAMNVLITGATGFIGKHLLQHLLQNEVQVFSLIRNPHKFQQQKLSGKAIFLDLSQKNFSDDFLSELPDKLDCVVHCAGMLFSNCSEKFYQINYRATQNLVIALSNRYPKSKLKFIYLSSVAANGPSVGTKATAYTCDTPISHYGHSKLKAEIFLREHLPWGWQLNIVRPPIVFGPNDQATKELFLMVKSRFILYPGSAGQEKRYSFICVFDLVNYLKKIIYYDGENYPTPLPIGPYYPCFPQSCCYQEIMEAIKRELRINVTININVPLVLLRAFCNINNFLYSKMEKTLSNLNHDKLAEIVQREWVFSSHSLDKLIGAVYQYNLEETIKSSYKLLPPRRML